MTLVWACVLVACAGCSREGGVAREGVVVTTSWLASAVRDVAGEDVPVAVLSPPGSCPGHFDMKPSQLAELRAARLFVRFDFQEGVERRLAGAEGLVAVGVHPGEGLCLPAGYLDACRQLAPGVCRCFPDERDRCAARLTALERRMAALGEEVRGRVACSTLSGSAAIASHHQEAFARWLGLDVVGTFRAGDEERPAAVESLVRTGGARRVRFVIANRQEGDRLARRLAERLEARLVVFSNFPDPEAGGSRFDDLVRANVEALLEGSTP
jgi:zinc transport system substrate-binding protein